MLLPLRLFLGVTFIYAGLQKLTDPQFFNPSAHGYIGKQIAAFATGSPLHSFLLQVAVPHATLFGLLVSFGELAIGIGAILGLLLRPAAFFGLLISLLFFLSATWRVFPYFYGSDIVFVFCWLTLLIAGPLNTGLPSLDAIFVQRIPLKQRKQLAPLFHFLLGVGEEPAEYQQGASLPIDDTQSQENRSRTPSRTPTRVPSPAPTRQRPSQQQSRYLLEQRTKKESRRNFLLGTLTGGAGMLALAWLWNTLHLFPLDSNTGANGSASTATATPSSSGTPATSSATPAGTGATIAQANAVQNNSSVNFTIASSGDPGILVRLNNGNFVAYDAICTHAGCPVDYDSSQQLLVCPCHGAVFDPAKAAAVIQGPASIPLTSVPIKVDSTTGTITVSQ